MPLLGKLKADFYLAGGTALALQIGHRDSIDFDFFSFNDFDPQELFMRLEEIFKEHKIIKVQEERNTLTVFIDDEIKISFFGFAYKLIMPKQDEEYLCLASIEDIACMKLSAILSRATNKDYIDLYFIIKKIKLAHLIELAQKKLPAIDSNLILKSLVYFEDVSIEPINFKHGHEVEFDEVKKELIRVVKDN